jgi:hypothetical protein
MQNRPLPRVGFNVGSIEKCVLANAYNNSNFLLNQNLQNIEAFRLIVFSLIRIEMMKSYFQKRCQLSTAAEHLVTELGAMVETALLVVVVNHLLHIRRHLVDVVIRSINNGNARIIIFICSTSGIP